MVVSPWWVQVLLLLSSLWCCVLNRVVRKAMRWIWVIAKIEAEEEMGAWVRSLPPSEGLCLSIPFLLFCWSWKVGKRGGTTFLSGCVEPEWLRWWGSQARWNFSASPHIPRTFGFRGGEVGTFVSLVA
eukprot:g54389.t1